MLGDYMPDSFGAVPNQFLPITIDHLGVSALRAVGFVLGELDTVQFAPLQHHLLQAGVDDEVIRRSMPNRHDGILSRVPGVKGLDLCSPLRSRLVDLPVRTCSICIDWVERFGMVEAPAGVERTS